jgi:hypothetical protein
MIRSAGPQRDAWLGMAVLVVALLAAAPPRATALGAAPDPLEADPFEEIEAFTIGGAVGTLILPAGAPDRVTPAVVILQDSEGPDGRAGLYTDQLLGAVLAGLAMHPRLAGQRLGLLGFGAGARRAAFLPARMAEGVAARALLYPACEGMAPASMTGQAVLLMYGDADPANPPQTCAILGGALAGAGATLRLSVLRGAGYAWDRLAFASEGQVMLHRPDGAGRVATQAWPAMTALSATEVAYFFAASLLGSRP